MSRRGLRRHGWRHEISNPALGRGVPIIWFPGAARNMPVSVRVAHGPLEDCVSTRIATENVQKLWANARRGDGSTASLSDDRLNSERRR